MEKTKNRGGRRRPLKPIMSSKDRKATFLKRRGGIMKKAMELHTLCDIPTLVICFGADTTDVKTWPEDPNEVIGLVARYAGISRYERSRWRQDTETLMKAQIDKTRSEIRRMREESDRKKNASVDGLPEVGDFSRFLDAKIEAIEQRISYLSNSILASYEGNSPLDLKNCEKSPLHLKNCLLADDMFSGNDRQEERNEFDDEIFACFDRQQMGIYDSDNHMFDDDTFAFSDHSKQMLVYDSSNMFGENTLSCFDLQRMGLFNDNNVNAASGLHGDTTVDFSIASD